MNAFERYNQSPPTEQEWIEREEDLARSEEARLQRLDESYNYPVDCCGNCGVTGERLYEAPDGTWMACDEWMEEAVRVAKRKPVPVPRRAVQIEMFPEAFDPFAEVPHVA
jgi:hypothetical protein